MRLAIRRRDRLLRIHNLRSSPVTWENYRAQRNTVTSLIRRASIYHTRLRLGFSCLREYLFKINRCASPFCECGLDTESVKHFFLFCPRYAAQRNLLLTSAANILGETWSSSSDAKKLNFLLYGVKSANYDINCALFREVQTFIINTNRFSMATV